MQSVRESDLSTEQKHYLLLWQEAVGLAKGTKHDPGDIYHALCNLELTPEEQLDGGFVRAGRV